MSSHEHKTPWTRANAQRKSRRQEQRIKSLPGGKAQLNSGRHWFSKRDNTLAGFLVEARITDAGSYTVRKDEFDTLTKNAIQTPPGMLPMMMVEIDGLRLVVMRETDHLAREAEMGVLRGDLIDAKTGKTEKSHQMSQVQERR